MVATCFVSCTLLFYVLALHDRPCFFSSALSSALITCNQALCEGPPASLVQLVSDLLCGFGTMGSKRELLMITKTKIGAVLNWALTVTCHVITLMIKKCHRPCTSSRH